MAMILAIGGSSSRRSINKQFASFAARRVAGAEVTVLDLNDFEMPLFSVDREASDGIPPAVRRFVETVRAHDGLVVSLAEHNGSYSTAFKNLFDWVSRHEHDMWEGRPMFLLSTSPGGRGGATVHATASDRFPRHGARIVAAFSLPSFHDNFSEEVGITDPELAKAFRAEVGKFEAALGEG